MEQQICINLKQRGGPYSTSHSNSLLIGYNVDQSESWRKFRVKGNTILFVHSFVKNFDMLLFEIFC